VTISWHGRVGHAIRGGQLHLTKSRWRGELHGQGVHVRAQPDGAAARVGPPANDGDHACLADARMMLDPERGEALADDPGGAVLLETELGMHVKVAAQGREFRMPGGDVRYGIGHDGKIKLRRRARCADAGPLRNT